MVTGALVAAATIPREPSVAGRRKKTSGKPPCTFALLVTPGPFCAAVAGAESEAMTRAESKQLKLVRWESMVLGGALEASRNERRSGSRPAQQSWCQCRLLPLHPPPIPGRRWV